MTMIDRMHRDFGDYYFPELVDTVIYILKVIFLCIIKVQSSDQEESQ
jgi:hypothetical protein